MLTLTLHNVLQILFSLMMNIGSISPGIDPSNNNGESDEIHNVLNYGAVSDVYTDNSEVSSISPVHFTGTYIYGNRREVTQVDN